MRTLYLKWKSFAADFVKNEMLRRGYTVFELEINQSTSDTRNSEKLASAIAIKIMESKVDFVFSLNYFPVAAIAANACNVKYISWTYDSPYIQLYSKTIDLPTNYAFVFDKAEYLNLKGKGIGNVYFLPMGGAAEAYDRITITNEDYRKYDAEISMIGSMYSENDKMLTTNFDKVDTYVKGYLDSLVQAQKNVSGCNVIESAISSSVLEKIQKYVPIYPNGDGYESAEWILSNYFLARKITSEERYEYLEMLSESQKVVLYTQEPTPRLPKVDNRGRIHYFEEMSKAMKCSKINLNISLRSIVTGIPLRSFDIMASGGFLLTTYQEDMLDFFIPDKDFVFFYEKNDLLEKVRYYLSHDDERKEIAKNGYEKVKAFHSFKQRFDSIEETVFNRNNREAENK